MGGQHYADFFKGQLYSFVCMMIIFQCVEKCDFLTHGSNTYYDKKTVPRNEMQTGFTDNIVFKILHFKTGKLTANH